MEHIPTAESLQDALADVSNVEWRDSGGFKAMYTAQVEGKQEALKVVYLPPEAGETEEQRSQLNARLKRELDVLEKCRNPNLVKLGKLKPRNLAIDGREYMVYSEELLCGLDLRFLIAQSRKEPDIVELVNLALASLSVVRDLWTMGYVHRDIKPANIIRTEQEERRFVLLDLGIAFNIHGTQLTASGHTIGTRLYMPPELFSPDYKSSIDFRSDVYSIGVSLFEYASGKHPLVRQPEDDFTTVYRIITQRPDKLEQHRPDLPRTFCNLVDRCMRKTPALRYSDLDSLIRELEVMI